ncbi:hypothetical protein [Embleya sp. NPDC001921]
MARTPLEPVEHWTLSKDERALVSGKRGATTLGFAALLKFYAQYGRRRPQDHPNDPVGEL